MSDEDSLPMIASSVKSPSEKLFDAVNFRGDITRGNPRHFCDSVRVYSFEKEQDHLPIEGFEAANKSHESLQRDPSIREVCGIHAIVSHIDTVDAYQLPCF